MNVDRSFSVANPQPASPLNQTSVVSFWEKDFYLPQQASDDAESSLVSPISLESFLRPEDLTRFFSELDFSKSSEALTLQKHQVLSFEPHQGAMGPVEFDPLTGHNLAVSRENALTEQTEELDFDRLVEQPLSQVQPSTSEALDGTLTGENSKNQLAKGVGKTDNQANQAMYANFARILEEVDGTGLTIGVISDSYDVNKGDATNAIDDIVSGDLPGLGNPLGRLTPVQVLAEANGPGFDEGRGMMQLIHDIAPGAKLLFHTANDATGRAFTDRSVANAIRSLAAAGADIIVDNVNGFESPFFQDGEAAKAVDEVAQLGIVYFTSAANNSRAAYDSSFRNSGQIFNPGQLPLQVTSQNNTPALTPMVPLPAFNGGIAHDFDPGPGIDFLQGFTLGGGERMSFTLQWDDPFFANGTGLTPNTDLDVYILNAQGTAILGGSALINAQLNPRTNQPIGSIEFLTFVNPSQQTTQFNIMIVQASSAAPQRMTYIFNAGFGLPSNLEFVTNSPTIYGHKNAKGAITLGATDYTSTPAFEPLADTPGLERFSSIGGVPILFDQAGNRLSQPETRLKPDLVAPDGVNTTFFGAEDPLGSGRFEKDGLPNFFGTSAAAPNAAGVAALMLQVAPWATPADIGDAMRFTALDMDDPNTPNVTLDQGFDFATGYGFLMADRAVAVLSLFDETFYLSQNPDIATAVQSGTFRNGFEHFIKFGQFEDRDPSSRFNNQVYLAQNPDVVDAINRGFFASGFDHFLQKGQSKGRDVHNLYSENYYLEQNPEIELAIKEGNFRSGYEHFLLFGQSEGRKASPFFDEGFYLAQNPDVAEAVRQGIFRSGFEHFTQIGQFEGKSPNPLLDESRYLQENPDVAASVKAGVYRSGIEHFVLFGRVENRPQ